ncbi:MAG: hypothetical protein LBT73_01425 [Tannerellaceae bacterium]|nr:hypothetical protein [Tannerellaceae bacterium]
MKQSELDYWQRTCANLAKLTFAILCLPGLALLFTAVGESILFAFMALLGAFFTLLFIALGALFARLDASD